MRDVLRVAELELPAPAAIEQVLDRLPVRRIDLATEWLDGTHG
jgi:hypothetical protein